MHAFFSHDMKILELSRSTSMRCINSFNPLMLFLQPDLQKETPVRPSVSHLNLTSILSKAVCDNKRHLMETTLSSLNKLESPFLP